MAPRTKKPEPAPELSPVPNQAAVIVDLRHDQIVPDPDNARRKFDEGELAKLADTIFVHGILQKPVVRAGTPRADGDPVHELLMGERRWRAWGLLIADGRWPADHTEPCPVSQAEASLQLEAGLIENLQRVDLDHMERGEGFELLATRHGRTNKQIAEAIGYTPEYVQQHRRLTQLDDETKERVREGKLSLHDALNTLKRNAEAAKKAEAFRDREVRLALAEFTHAVAKVTRGGWFTYNWIRVQADAEEDRGYQALAKVGVIQIRQDWQTREHQAAFTYANQPDVLAVQTVMREANRDEALHTLRTEILGEEAAIALDGRYACGWLEGPFALSEEDQAYIDEQDRLKSEREAAAKAEKERTAEANKGLQAIARDVRKTVQTPVAPQAIETIEAAGVKLPLSVKDDNIVDALGRKITGYDYGYSDKPKIADKTLALKALVLAANAAFGFRKTPDPTGDADAGSAAGAEAEAEEGAASASPNPTGPLAPMLTDEFAEQLRQVSDEEEAEHVDA